MRSMRRSRASPVTSTCLRFRSIVRRQVQSLDWFILPVRFWTRSALGGSIGGDRATSTFERAWSAALGAVQDAGVQVTSSDPNAGEIRGIRDGIDVAVTVSRQPDGRTRVQFDAKGPTDRDPGLPTRFSDAYDRRMGR